MALADSAGDEQSKILLLRAGAYNVELNYTGSRQLTISGGWDAGFSDNRGGTSSAVIRLTISGGGLVVDNLTLAPDPAAAGVAHAPGHDRSARNMPAATHPVKTADGNSHRVETK